MEQSPTTMSDSETSVVSTQATTQAQIQCPRCQQLIGATAKFCQFCGTSFTQPLGSATPPMQPAYSSSPPMYAPTISPFQATVNSMRNASRGIRVVGALLFLLFFSPFVSCSNVGLFQSTRSEFSAAELVTGTIGTSVQNRNQGQSGGNVLLLSLLIQPIAGIALYVIGEKWSKRLDVQGSMLPAAGGAQSWLGITLGVLCLFFAAIKFTEDRIFFDLEWGYTLSFLTVVTGIVFTRMWNGGLTKLRQFPAAPPPQSRYP